MPGPFVHAMQKRAEAFALTCFDVNLAFGSLCSHREHASIPGDPCSCFAEVAHETPLLGRARTGSQSLADLYWFAILSGGGAASRTEIPHVIYFPYWVCGFIFLGSRETLRVSSRRAKTASSDALRS